MLLAILFISSAMLFRLSSLAPSSDISELADDQEFLNGTETRKAKRCSAEFTCGNQDEYPVSNPDHTPSASGCGSYGFSMFEKYPDITECCNVHDICYDTCLKNRNNCDRDLEDCLEQIDASRFIRGLLSSMVYQVTNVLGCKAFHNAQKKACICAA